MSNSNDVAYCGLYCGDCIIKNEKISKLSGEMLRIMNRKEFEKLANGLPHLFDKVKNLSNAHIAVSVLESMCELDCEKNCKSGGGSSACAIRKCNIELGLDGCWECDKFENCATLAWLEPIHQKANVKNIEVIRKKGMAHFLSGEKLW